MQYVYIFLDENNQPYYVGRTEKLSRTRSLRRNADCNAETARILEAGLSRRTIVINCNNTIETTELEIFLVAQFGRRDLGTGCLTNWTRGGEWPIDLSEASRKRMSEAAKERGIGGTALWKEDTREKVRLSQIGNKKGLNRVASEAERQATSERSAGNQYAMGFIHSAESCDKKSVSLTGRVFTEEWKRKLQYANRPSQSVETTTKRWQAIRINQKLRNQDIYIPTRKELRQARRAVELNRDVDLEVQTYWTEYDKLLNEQ